EQLDVFDVAKVQYPQVRAVDTERGVGAQALGNLCRLPHQVGRCVLRGRHRAAAFDLASIIAADRGERDREAERSRIPSRGSTRVSYAGERGLGRGTVLEGRKVELVGIPRGERRRALLTGSAH